VDREVSVNDESRLSSKQHLIDTIMVGFRVVAMEKDGYRLTIITDIRSD